MARSTFGGTTADTVAQRVRILGHDVDDYNAATLTVWSAQTGGTQYTDLLVNGGASSSVPVDATGQIPEFQGPDGVAIVWVSAGGARVKMLPAEGPTDTSVAAYVNDPASGTRAALSGTFAPASGNSFIPAGDSLSSFVFANNVPNWAVVAAAASNGRLTVIRSAGVSGDTSAQLLARLQADVIDYSPALVSVLIGTNDVPATPTSTFQSNVTAIHDNLRRAGIASVVCTIPPRNDGGSTYLTTIAQWNAWLKKFAYTTNRPLWDFHAVVADRATGQISSAYTSASSPFSGVHFTAPGNAILGAYVADKVPSLLPPYEPLRPSSNVDPNSLVSNGLLLNSSGGIPTGFTPAGGATAVAETLITNDADFRGNAWQWVFTTTDTPMRQFQTLLSSGWAVGHTLRFQARVKVISASGLGQGDGVHLPIVFDGASSGAVQYITLGIQAGTGLYSADFVVPAGTTGIYFEPECHSTTGQAITARVGELAAFDLTALGIA
jgi:lysophospholipase L1-like esterase